MLFELQEKEEVNTTSVKLYESSSQFCLFFGECTVKSKISQSSKYKVDSLVICYLRHRCIMWPHAEITCNCVTTAEPNNEENGQNKCSWAENWFEMFLVTISSVVQE